MTQLFTSVDGFRDTANGAPKTQYDLGQSSGGGDGITFAIGNEVFTWNSNSVPSSVKPRRIISLWIDATGLTAGKNLIVQAGRQTFVVPGGTSQGFSIFAGNPPFNVQISTNGGTGTVHVIAYDYNVLFTGTSSGGGSVVQASGSGSSGAGGGGQSYGGGGGGGGRGFL